MHRLRTAASLLVGALVLTGCTSEPVPTPLPTPPPSKPESVQLDPYSTAPTSLTQDKLSKREKALLTDLGEVKLSGDFLTGVIDGEENNYGLGKDLWVSFVRTDYALDAFITAPDGTGAMYDSVSQTDRILRAYSVTAETQALLDVLVPALTTWKQRHHYWPQAYYDSNKVQWILSGNPVGRYNGTVVLALPPTFEAHGRIIVDGDGYFTFSNTVTGETVRVRVQKGKIRDAVAVAAIPVA